MKGIEMSDQDKDKDQYQYRVKISDGKNPQPATTVPTHDPKTAGEAYRDAKKYLEKGQEATLQRRPMGKWEDIDKDRK
jgi:hypothetical protein